MTVTLFVFLLTFYAALTTVITEGIKNTFMVDAETKWFSLVALIVALIVGIVGTFVFYLYNHAPINLENVISAILLGLASALTSMVGYDKVHDVLKML